MAGLLDFLQSASNTAADTVAAPVDLLAWALRKAGVPVPQNAIGGSEWLKQQGLKRDVPQSAASLAGETVGLLSPMVAAAKAPQIAKGLLQVEANAAAPRTLRPEAGAIVWQGSPHKYDAEKLVRLPSGEQVYVGGKFNAIKEVPPGATVLQDFPLGRIRSEAIGTGEGAQAYGHGSYLAEARDVANTYAIPRGVPDVEGLAFERGLRLSRDARIELMRQSNSQRDAVEAAKMLQNASREARTLPVEKLADTIQAFRQAREPQLYKVDLPDNMIARMLDWDKPLSQQAPEVRRAAAGRLDEIRALGGNPPQDPSGQWLHKAFQPQAGEQGFGQALAADRLRAAGIPGIRFLDGGSRGAGQGTSNFVVFPGEEQYLRILERNGGLLAP